MAKSKQKSISRKKATSRPASRKKPAKSAKPMKSKIAKAAKPKAKKPAPRSKSPARQARSSESVLHRLFDRVKPILTQPLDPRIRHLVEVFGTEAVVSLMEVYRQRKDAADVEELRDAVSAANDVQPPPMHGSWAWHELMTRDVEGSKRFYRALFGWESSDIEMMPGFNYTTFRKEGRDLAGMLSIRPEHGEMPSGWGVYVAVDDVDSAADMAESLGSEIVVPAHDIPVGRWAMIKDPGGAVICLYRAKS